MALVLYDDALQNSVLTHFHAHERTFNFTSIGHVTIEQNWSKHGVAAVVWEAAIFLANFLINMSGSLKGKKILELGSGTGLTGIVACKLNADVTLTDKLDALETLQRNVDLNLNSTINRYGVKALSWGENLDTWKDTTYDIIIGADLVYDVSVLDKLVRTMKHFVDINENTIIWLCGKLRYREKYDKFRDFLKSDFTVKDHGIPEDNIYLLEIKKKY